MRFKVWFEDYEDAPVGSAKQTRDYSCGAAVLRSIADYYDVGPDSEEDFMKLSDTGERKGAHPDELLHGVHRLGLRGQMIRGMTLERLKALLDQGVPVICLVQAWGDQGDYKRLESGHYIIAVGYQDGKVFFEDPYMKGDARGFLPEQEFMTRWCDQESYTDRTQYRLGIAVFGKPKEAEHKEKARKIV